MWLSIFAFVLVAVVFCSGSCSCSCNCLSIYLSIYLSISLSICLLSIYLPVFLQDWKRSYSARLPQFLATSKRQQFSETSSFFEVDNIKNETILRDVLQKWKVEYQFVLRFFQSICLNYCACREKVMPGHTKCSRKIISANLKISGSKMQPPLRKSTPGPPNSSDEHVSCTAPATENASLQILFKCPTPALVFGNATKPSRFAHFWQGAQSLAPATQNNTWTSKSGANMSCFVHFDFEMCFAPQRRALFRHRNFQKWSGPRVFCAFWLRNVLRAATACTFSTSQLPKVVRR